jgi:hypothetical protein
MNINNWGPFDAGVWGTVSDWAMVIVTLGTAIVLVKTLRSQKEGQRLQQFITDIESERYRIEYLPKFEIAAGNINNVVIGATIRSTVHFKLKLLENEAKEVNVIGKHGTGRIQNILISVGTIGQHMPIQVVYPVTEYDLYFTVLPNTILFPNEGCYFFFALTFKDSIGNGYEQLCSISFKEAFLNFSSGKPERIIVKPKV